MNQSELIDKVAQKTTLTQAAATEAVKAVVQVVLESLLAGEPVQCGGTACARRAESANRGEY
jgi:nucleoid DNA-binding protein